MIYTDNNLKTIVVRITVVSHNYLKQSGRRSKRTISGQLSWVCEVVERLEKDYPSVYARISSQLSNEG